MANKYFYVHNGLVTGALTIDGPTGNLQTAGVFSSTSVLSASNTVTGALVIAGGAGIGQNLYVGGSIYSNGTSLVLNAGNISSYAVTQVNAGTDTAVAGTVGTITVWNTSTLQTITNRGAVTTNAITINNSTNPTTSTNGALIITGGGGIGIAGNAMIGGNMQVWGPTTFSGPVTFNGTATYAFSTNTFFTDNILEVHVPPTGIGTPWTVDDGKDIGLRFHYYNRANSTDSNAALVLTDSAQYLEFFSNGTENASGDMTNTTYGTFRTGSVILVNTSTGTSLGAGALQVAGGIYAGGSSYINGNLTVSGSINATISGTTAQANNLNFGNTGTLVYQTAPNVTGFLSPGTAGYVLISNGGNNIPSYVSPASFSVGTATNVSITNTNNNSQFYLGFFNTSATGNTGSYVSANLSFNPSTNVLTAGQFSGSGAGLNNIPNSALNNSSITITGGTGITTAPANGVVALGGTITVNNVGVTQFLGGTTGLTSTNATGTVTLTGTLGTANGGTNNTAIGAAGTVVYSDGTKYNFLSSGTVGQILVQGTNAVAWSNGTTLTVGTATNIAGGVANELVYQTGAGVTGFITTPTTAGQLLQWNGTTIIWATTGSLYAGNATTSTNIAGGATGSIPYQSTSGVTTYIPIGGVGYILQSNGTTATWVSTSSLFSGEATTATNIGGGNSGLIPIQVSSGQTAFINSGSVGNLLVQGINTSTWQSTSTITVAYAGTATNNAGGAAGQIGIQSGPGLSSYIPAPAAGGYLLQSIGTTTATFVTTATLVVGGAVSATNLALGTTGQVPYQSAPGVTAFVTAGAAGTVLMSNGTAAPTYVTQSTLSVGTATNVAGGAAGQMHIQVGPGITAFIPAGTSVGQLLQWQGGNTATWVSTGSLVAGIASSASNIIGGTAGQIVYQSGPGATNFAGPGTAGQVLVSNGTSAPIYQSTLTLSSTVAAATTNTGALQVAGGVGVGGSIAVGGQLIFTSTSTGIVQTGQSIAVGLTATVIDSFSTATYRSAKYVVSVSNTATGLFQSTEALVIHNGVTAFIQESSVVTTTTYGLIMTFDAIVTGGNVTFVATGVANANIVRVLPSYVTV